MESFRVAPGQSLRVEQGRGRTRRPRRRARDAPTRRHRAAVQSRRARVSRPTSWCRRSSIDCCRRVEDGADEIVVGDLSTRRDFSDVRDVVRAYRLLVERGVSGEVYNIASGIDVGLFDIAQRLVAAIAPRRCASSPTSRCIRPVEVPVSRGSYEKIRRATKWRPRSRSTRRCTTSSKKCAVRRGDS